MLGRLMSISFVRVLVVRYLTAFTVAQLLVV